MKPDPLAIFQSREDHVSWGKYEHQIDLIDELREEEKQRAKSGIRYLRRLLGNQFLRHGAADGNPVFLWFFNNSAPHARRFLIRLAEELKSFADAPFIFNTVI